MIPAFYGTQDQKPLPSIIKDDASIAVKTETSFQEYFKLLLPALETYWHDYFKLCTYHQEWYLGQGHAHDTPRVRTADGSKPSKEPVRSVPSVFNHAFDMVEQRNNRLARFKPTIEVLPAHLEPTDEQNARLQKIIQKQIARRNKLELTMQRGDRVNAVMGSVFYRIEFDQRFGPYIDRKDKEKGREGDVRITLQDPRDIMFWPTMHYDDSPLQVEIYEVLHKNEAKKKYGKECAVKHDRSYYSISELSEIRMLLADHVIIYRFLLKPSEFHQAGAAILCYQDGTVLAKEKEYPFSHNGFPQERLTDIDLVDTPYPFSTFGNIIQPQKHHDKMLGLIHRNFYLLSHPKIMMPTGSCKLSSWANTPLFVEYNSSVEPRVVTFGTSHPEARQMLDWHQSQIERLYGIQGVSRGSPPPGTRSNVQQVFYEEQEQQRASIDIIKRNECTRRIYHKSTCEVRDHYPTSSKERLVREVGKNNEPVLRAISTASLAETDLEIEIQNSTAFSESKALRNQEVLDLLDRKPDLLTNEQLADILELGQTDKVYDITTSALRKAEFENQDVRYGNTPPDPDRYEDIISHLRSHYTEVQSIAFSRLPEASKQKMFTHIEITEGLAEELVDDGNELFLSELKTLRQYPMFYKKSPEPGQAASADMAADPTAGEVPPGMDTGQLPNEFVTPPGPQGADIQTPPIEQ